MNVYIYIYIYHTNVCVYIYIVTLLESNPLKSRILVPIIKEQHNML